MRIESGLIPRYTKSDSYVNIRRKCGSLWRERPSVGREGLVGLCVDHGE